MTQLICLCHCITCQYIMPAMLYCVNFLNICDPFIKRPVFPHLKPHKANMRSWGYVSYHHYLLMFSPTFRHYVLLTPLLSFLLHLLPQDDHGYISREFHRRYRLPSNVDQSAITCTLSGDGLLTLCGPKTGGSEYGRGDRTIPVTHDDKPNPAPSS